jgi:hypothetical protein
LGLVDVGCREHEKNTTAGKKQGAKASSIIAPFMEFLFMASV